MHTELPAAPGALLGYAKSGRPFFLLAGGAGDGEGEGGTDDAGNDDQNGPGGQDGGSPGADDDRHDEDRGEGGGSDSDSGGQDDAAARTARTIAAIREDFKGERKKRQDAEKRLAALQSALDADKAEREKQRDALAVALGIKPTDEPPDPAKLAEELKAAREKAQADLDERDASLRSQSVELAVLKAAPRLNADGPALLDSRSFLAKLTDLNPEEEGFAESLTEAITAAIEAAPQYQLRRERGARRPPEFEGGGDGGARKNGSGPSQLTREQLSGMSPADIVKARREGRLDELQGIKR